ncbi:MAG: hypothetical protein IIA07_11835 [Proteobacteria bacterium]|nr:hypothetical protein [Pseudomonadota bacterium]
MDKLAERLRHDAGQIDVTISAELDDRIRASLHGVKPESQTPIRSVSRPSSFWWASGLTGIAVAFALVVILNLQSPEPAPVASNAVIVPLVLPTVKWNVRTAVLTNSLEQEFEDLASDLKRAEQALKEDIDAVF